MFNNTIKTNKCFFGSYLNDVFNIVIAAKMINKFRKTNLVASINKYNSLLLI